MRGLGSTILLCLAVLAFFGFVALEDYSWTSWEAYIQVRSWEFCTVVVVAAVFLVIGTITSLYDWCLSCWYSRKHRKRKYLNSVSSTLLESEMKNGVNTTGGASAKSAGAAKTKTASEPPYVPLDINDPDGRFGTWMPGDDPDDWR